MSIKQIIQDKIDILSEEKQVEVLTFLNSLIENHHETEDAEWSFFP